VQKYILSELDSGERVISERLAHVRSVAIGFWIGAGSRDLVLVWGGVSHIDTFDPKPKLAELDGKPFDGFYQVGAKKETNRKWVKSPWAFKQQGKSGLWVSELFPQVAMCADDITLIRSMVSGFPLHPRANLLMHTGRTLGGFPSLGSWVNYALGSENKNLPGFVVLSPGQGGGGGRPREPGADDDDVVLPLVGRVHELDRRLVAAPLLGERAGRDVGLEFGHDGNQRRVATVATGPL